MQQQQQQTASISQIGHLRTNNRPDRGRSRPTRSMSLKLILVLIACLAKPAAAWFNLEQSQHEARNAATNQLLTPTLSPPLLQPASQILAQPVQPSQALQLMQSSLPMAASTLVEAARSMTSDSSGLDSPQPVGGSPLTDSTSSSQAAAHEESAGQPSLVGKILDGLSSQVMANKANQTSEKIAQMSQQLLKPRKSASDVAGLTNGSPNKRVQSAEQLIINQHARVHSFPSNSQSHQRHLQPNKQRDHKLGDSSSASSASRDSPLNPLNLFSMSGISSRSSIVKAISDNKLARKMADVGKSIGGNRYVAGAAALAALGLTFSKLFAPYIYANSYSKLATDPMMSSSSYLSPSLTSAAYLGNEPDRYYYAPGNSNENDAMLSSSSGPIRSTSSPYPYASFDPNTFGQLDSSAATTSPATSSYQSLYPASLQPSYYFTYKPVAPASPFNTRLSTTGTQASSQAAAQGDIQGHYTSFYSSHPASESSTFREYQLAGSNGGSEVPMGQQQYGDQMMLSASVESPSVQPKPSYHYIQSSPMSNSGNSRRSGPVALKMDSATKLRLRQHLQSQLANTNSWPTVQYVPLTNVNNNNNNNNNQYESSAMQFSPQGAQLAKSSRFEANEILPIRHTSQMQQNQQQHQQVHAPMNSDKFEQGHDLAQSGSAPNAAYLLIRPKSQLPAGGPWKSVSSPSITTTTTINRDDKQPSSGSMSNERLSDGKSDIIEPDQQVAQAGFMSQSTTNGAGAIKASAQTQKIRISRTQQQSPGKSVKAPSSSSSSKTGQAFTIHRQTNESPTMNDEAYLTVDDSSSQQWQQMSALPQQQQQVAPNPQATITNLIRLTTAGGESNDHDNKRNGENSNSNDDGHNNNNAVKHIESMTNNADGNQNNEIQQSNTSKNISIESSSGLNGTPLVATGELSPAGKTQMAADDSSEDETVGVSGGRRRR